MADRYWVGDGGNWTDDAHWSASSGGAGGASAPDASDNAIFDAASFSTTGQTVSVSSASVLSVTFQAIDQAITLSIATELVIYATSTFSAGMTISGAGDILFETSVGSAFLNPNGVTFGVRVLFGHNGGGSSNSWTLTNDFVCTGSRVFIEEGTFDADTLDVTCSGITIQNDDSLAQPTVNMGSGTWTITNPTGNSFFVGDSSGGVASPTINAETSLLVFDFSSLSSATGGLTTERTAYTFNNITVLDSTAGGDNTFRINAVDDDLTFANFVSNESVNILLTSGKTFTGSSFSLNGSPGTQIALSAITGGSAASLSISGAVNVSYTTVTDNTAMDNIPFLDEPGGIDGGNALNWDFGGVPQIIMI